MNRIEAQYESYRKVAIPAGASENQLLETKRAFLPALKP